MPLFDRSLERDEYQLVLTQAGLEQVWAWRDGNTLRLPQISIPRWARPARQLQEAIKARWKLRTIVLELFSCGKDSADCAVLEISSPGPPSGMVAAALREIAVDGLSDDDLGAIEAILRNGPSVRGPFSRLGWAREALEWAQEEAGYDVKFTGEIRQYNAAGHFALLRFRTHDGTGYWLKATGEANSHEFGITKLLSELCTDYIPPRIAERSDWNAWLMGDAGNPLRICTLPALERAAASMSELQQRTIGRTDAFLARGASDHRLSAFRARVPRIFQSLEEIMARQVSDKVPRIGARRLEQMAGILCETCLRMEALGIPDTVVHEDMNPGNILFQGSRCVFTDWCEVSVSNPFFGLEYMRLLARESEGKWTSKVGDCYSHGWLDRLHSAQICAARKLAPPLAILAYLDGRLTRLRSSTRKGNQVEGYCRALARRIDRALAEPQFMEIPCH